MDNIVVVNCATRHLPKPALNCIDQGCNRMLTRVEAILVHILSIVSIVSIVSIGYIALHSSTKLICDQHNYN